jgi:CDP-diacylglycerol--glycerol-3-phosphate 3-phosphatidyltransferase
LVREFLVGVVLRALLAKRARSLPANRLGKLKTVTQIVAVLLLTLMRRGDAVALTVLYVAVALTVISGYVYFADTFRGRGHVEWVR